MVLDGGIVRRRQPLEIFYRELSSGRMGLIPTATVAAVSGPDSRSGFSVNRRMPGRIPLLLRPRRHGIMAITRNEDADKPKGIGSQCSKASASPVSIFASVRRVTLRPYDRVTHQPGAIINALNRMLLGKFRYITRTACAGDDTGCIDSMGTILFVHASQDGRPIDESVVNLLALSRCNGAAGTAVSERTFTTRWRFVGLLAALAGGCT